MRGRSQRGIAAAVGVSLALTLALSAQERRLPARTSASERRVALVIGNNAYQYASRLDNAVNDASAVAAELQAAGFDVALHKDLDRRGMHRVLGDFVARLSSGAIAVIYFAGHGVQIQGENYLLPVDLNAEQARDVIVDGIRLSASLQDVTAANVSFALAILDACRNNPFPDRARTLGLTRGLAAPAAPQGFMVVYSAGVGETALDRLNPSDRSPNGLFTRELLNAMKAPGLRIQEVVEQVKDSVIRQARGVGHQQHPAIYDQSTGTFFFRPPAAQTAGPAPAPPPVDADAMACDALKASRNAAAFEAYLAEFPRGSCASFARVRLADLRATPTPTPVTTPPPTPAPTAPAGGAGQTWVNPKDGLTYVRIPAGTFEMGCVPGDTECEGDEKPRHRVTLSKGFWMGRTEVTVGAWKRFVGATGHRSEGERGGDSKTWQAPGFEQGDDHPVVYVSWNDAQAYCGWTGVRLPTEAEWEYAARAGREAKKYVWGDETTPRVAGVKQANVADMAAKRKSSSWTIFEGYDDGFAETSPVGSFAANGYGLFDIAGNVWEWCSDWYGDKYYGSSPGQDPNGPSSAQYRVTRGGSGFNYPRYLRTSDRSGSEPSGRDHGVGFRCSRDVPP